MWKNVEKNVYDELYTFLVNNNLITKHQSGEILQEISCYLLPLRFFNPLKNTMKHGQFFLTFLRLLIKFGMAVLFLNFNVMAYQGPLLDFFNSYLRNRQQRVVLNEHLLNGTESDWKSIEDGVPQGSVLGPLLLWCTSMTFLKTFYLSLNYLPMILHSLRELPGLIKLNIS